LSRIDLGLLVHVSPRCEQGVAGILDVVDHPSLDTVKPDVPDETVGCGMRTGGQGGVADDGLGVRVGVVGVQENHPIVQKVSETAFTHPRQEPSGEITPELIDGDLQNKARRTGRGGGTGGTDHTDDAG